MLADDTLSQDLEAAGLEHGDICRILLRAWPKAWELEILLGLLDSSSGLIHGAMFAPFSSIQYQGTPSSHDSLQHPPLNSHPVLIARKLLTLATYLQSLSPTCRRSLCQLGIDYHAIMLSAVETAHSCVTSQDSLLESVEGIEAIMIESMYQSNAGNLRASWHLTGRAILIAQMMNLHRGTEFRSLKFLDPETRVRLQPEYLWFRLIQMNRYLSLMLGMLQGTPSSDFADNQVLEGCTPVDRMQRLDCAAGGYILQRNEAGLYDNAATNMIDEMLQNSMASLPSTWWLMPKFDPHAHDNAKILENVIRVIDQLTHHHLVAQLHLPNIMRSYADHEYDYSKTMAINASREVLTRFTSLNGIHAFTSFCRGISFLAFIACTTLCIIHIDVKRQRRYQDHDQCVSALLDLIAIQYEGDRVTMERTLDCMQYMSRDSEDQIASKTAGILRHLLSIEKDTTLCGKSVDTLSTGVPERGLGCGGRISDGGKVLQIHIPYFGTIKFERGSTSGLVSNGSQP